MNDGKKLAFTLAEVLITLAIIGVVAAMTIPTLVKSYQKNITETRLKLTYAVLQNAFNLSKVDNGDFDKWYWNEYPTTNGQRTQYFWNHFLLPYLKVSKVCMPATTECFSKDIKFLNGTVGNLTFAKTHISLILNNGAAIYSWTSADTYRSHVQIYVDINGLEKPNIVGKDIFVLMFYGSWAPESVLSKAASTYAYVDTDGNVSDSGIEVKNDVARLEFSGYNPNLSVSDYLNPNLRSLSSDGVISGSEGACSVDVTGNAGLKCGAAIKANNWKIPDGYPW